MGGGKTQGLRDAILGQHLSLTVAAHLARVQLVSNPLARYDAEHIIQMVELVAGALVKVAPLYVSGEAGATPREIRAAELEGATVGQGGALLVLKDGRMLSGISIKRGDLRHAIAVLRSVGVPGLEQRERKPALAPSPDPLQMLERIEALTRQAGPPRELNALLATLARHAADERVANLALQLMSALHESNDDRVVLALAQLRTVLNAQAQRAKQG